MNVALVIMGDGRDEYLGQMTKSLLANCEQTWTQSIYADDRDHTRGMAGNIMWAWEQLEPDIEYVFHIEEDFTFPGPIPLDEMVEALQKYPTLAQVCLKRQPWSPSEIVAGNMLQMIPGITETDGLCFHHNLFSFNPCVYPREVTKYSVLGERGAERELTDQLLDDGWEFAFFGNKQDDPRCTHIGVERSQGYRW